MKTETQKQYAVTLKAFKSANAYLAQHRKVDDAFTALEAEKETVEKGHKEFLAAAGHIEARRLLGEATEADTQQVSASLLQVRDQQDRLSAAKAALTERRKVLADQAEMQAQAALSSLTELSNALQKEIDAELTEAVDRLNSVAARCYAIYHSTGFDSWRDRDMIGLRINSLESGENLFRDPSRERRTETGGEPVAQWRLDPDAAKLHEQLVELGHTHKALQRMERQVLDARENA